MKKHYYHPNMTFRKFKKILKNNSFNKLKVSKCFGMNPQLPEYLSLNDIRNICNKDNAYIVLNGDVVNFHGKHESIRLFLDNGTHTMWLSDKQTK